MYAHIDQQSNSDRTSMYLRLPSQADCTEARVGFWGNSWGWPTLLWALARAHPMDPVALDPASGHVADGSPDSKLYSGHTLRANINGHNINI